MEEITSDTFPDGGWPFYQDGYRFGDTRTDSRDHLRPDAAGQFVLIKKTLDEAALTPTLSQR